ncbi:hypothetical protein AGMMS49928_00040 [Spirochaetia bacterium]|nr:hypothetical protein AGMMS49928_00040 [Spirochaetia bacterium]
MGTGDLPNNGEARKTLSLEFRNQQNEISRLLDEETARLLNRIGEKLPGGLLKKAEAEGLKTKLRECFNTNYQNLLDRYLTAAGDDQSDKIRTNRIRADRIRSFLAHKETEDAAWQVIKNAYKDNPGRPKTVTDVKLALHIGDADLIGPAYYYRAVSEYFIRDLIANHITAAVEKTLENKKFENPGSLEPGDFEPGNLSVNFKDQQVRENINKILDVETIRSKSFDALADSLPESLCGTSLGCQFIENFKNLRELVVREYEDMDERELPDERYQLRLRYYDDARLLEERKSYDVQMKSFEIEVRHAWDVLDIIYQRKKPFFKAVDFQDLAQKEKRDIEKQKEKTGEPLYENIEKVWDEFSFVKPAETEAERQNRSYQYEKDNIRQKISFMKNRLGEIDLKIKPAERRALEDRLDLLRRQYDRFDHLVNPYHVEPGLLLDLDITSIKRKKTTLAAVSKALTEFIPAVYKIFHDTAFAAYPQHAAAPEETTVINRKAPPEKAVVEEAKPAAEKAEPAVPAPPAAPVVAAPVPAPPPVAVPAAPVPAAPAAAIPEPVTKPIVTAEPVVAAKPVVPVTKPVVAAKPVVPVAKPVVTAERVVAVAKPVVTAKPKAPTRTTVRAKPVAVAKPAVPVTKPVVAAEPVVPVAAPVAAAKPKAPARTTARAKPVAARDAPVKAAAPKAEPAVKPAAPIDKTIITVRPRAAVKPVTKMEAVVVAKPKAAKKAPGRVPVKAKPKAAAKETAAKRPAGAAAKPAGARQKNTAPKKSSGAAAKKTKASEAPAEAKPRASRKGGAKPSSTGRRGVTLR